VETGGSTETIGLSPMRQTAAVSAVVQETRPGYGARLLMANQRRSNYATVREHHRETWDTAQTNDGVFQVHARSDTTNMRCAEYTAGS